MTDSPAKAHLRDVVNKIKTSGPSYVLMTNRQLLYLKESASAWLEQHPDNIDALKRYDLLVGEIERRKNMGGNI